MVVIVKACAVFQINFPRHIPEQERMQLLDDWIHEEFDIDHLNEWESLQTTQSFTHPVDVEFVRIYFQKIIENFVEDTSIESDVCGQQVERMNKQQRGICHSWEVISVEPV